MSFKGIEDILQNMECDTSLPNNLAIIHNGKSEQGFKAIQYLAHKLKKAEEQNAQLRRVVEVANDVCDILCEFKEPIPIDSRLDAYYKALNELKKLDRSQSLDEQ